MRLRLALSNPGKSLQRTLYIHIQNQHLRRFTTPGSVLRGTSVAPPLVNQSSLAWWSTGRRESVHHGLNTFFHPERTALFSKESRVTMAPEKGRTPCMINKRILYFLKTICLVEIKCLQILKVLHILILYYERIIRQLRVIASHPFSPKSNEVSMASAF